MFWIAQEMCERIGTLKERNRQGVMALSVPNQLPVRREDVADLILPQGQTPTSVYQYFDHGKVLIYVGITRQGIGRNRQHNADKEWWPYVGSQHVHHFAHRADAIDRERELIREHHPPFNAHHNPDHEVLRAAYIALQEAGAAAPKVRTLMQDRGYRIRLIAGRDRGQRVVLYTQHDDAPIAQCLRHAPKIWLHDGAGRRLGKVTSVTCAGYVARIVVESLKIDLSTVALTSPWAKIKLVDVKGPAVVELRIIFTAWQGVGKA